MGWELIVDSSTAGAQLVPRAWGLHTGLDHVQPGTAAAGHAAAVLHNRLWHACFHPVAAACVYCITCRPSRL